MSQFSYCPLIWMFHSRAMEHRISGIHESTFSLAKWLSVRLGFKSFLVRVQLQSLKTSDFALALSKEFLDIQATTEYGFTLKRVHDMKRTYSHS